MAHDFDEQEYARQLVAAGISAADAANVARRTAEARRKGGASGTPGTVQLGAVIGAVTERAKSAKQGGKGSQFDPAKLAGLKSDESAQEAWEAEHAEIGTEKLLRHLREWRQELAQKAAEVDREEAQRLQAKLAEIDADINDAETHLKALVQERHSRDTATSPAKRGGQGKAASSRKPTAKKGALTVSERKLLTVATEIATVPPTGEDMAFTHAVLCQVGLPRSKVEGREFMRQSGAAWVNVQAGYLDEGRGPVLQSIPYGAMPRLALAWVSTYAKRYSTREIPIGDSAAQFLAMMGKDDQGARYSTLRQQMHALAACRLQLGFRGRTFNGQPVEQFDAWVSDKDRHQRALWPGVMVLSEHYFGSLMDSAVPLDNRALLALSGSALALDVYAWLAHRLHRIEGKGVTLHWAALREQFAQEYQGKDPDKDFKKKFLPALKKVLAVYPQAKVKQVTGGLLLLGSPPPIPPKV